MADMQITVGFRRETGTDLLVFSFLQILVNNLFNKVFRNGFFCCFLFHLQFLHHLSFMVIFCLRNILP